MKDLFETPELIPTNINEILNRYWETYGEDMDYQNMADMHKEIEQENYTFESYLDNVPYGLRPINVKLCELIGYEN